jgi:branched-chain amino acid aminotransferase
MFCTGSVSELAGGTQVDERTIGDGNVGPVTKQLSDLYAKRTASEGAQVVLQRFNSG